MIQKGKDNLMVHGDNNNIMMYRKQFNGDYSISDCARKRYRFVPGWVALMLMAAWFGYLLLVAYNVITDIIHHGLFANTGMSSQTLVLSVVALMAVLWGIYALLPFMVKRFGIVFLPQEGMLYVLGKPVAFDDMMSMELIERDGKYTLRLYPKDGSRTIQLHFDGAKYVFDCIGRVWAA